MTRLGVPATVAALAGTLACSPPADRPEQQDQEESDASQAQADSPGEYAGPPPQYSGVITFQSSTSLLESSSMPPISSVMSGGSMKMEMRREVVTMRIVKGRGTARVDLQERKIAGEELRGQMACMPAERAHPVRSQNLVEEQSSARGTGEVEVEISLVPERGRYEGIVSWNVAAPGEHTRRTSGSSSGTCDPADVTPTSSTEKFSHEGGSTAFEGPLTPNTTVLSGSTTTEMENGEKVVEWYLAPNPRCSAESLSVKNAAQRLDRQKDKAFDALERAFQALPNAMHAAAEPSAEGSPATPLATDFLVLQRMLMELEQQYRRGNGRASEGELTAEVDPLSRRFVKDLDDNLTGRAQGPLAAIAAFGIADPATGERRAAVEIFLRDMQVLWEESVRAGSALQWLEQAKEALRACLSG